MKMPRFWNDRGWQSHALMPLSWLYQLAGLVRARTTAAYHSSLPVICVGNLTSGGTGKTPSCAYLAALLRQEGWRPVILSRGYGGQVKGPLLVNLDKHNANDIGDEPCLLAKTTPVVIARNRASGAAFIEQQAVGNLIIMDDGLQNPQLHKDISLCIFDGALGAQNGRIFPAGPLRTPIAAGRKLADMVLINGADSCDIKAQMAPCPALQFTLTPQQIIGAKAASYFAFAGIGRPERFFEMLARQNIKLSGTRAFADHHPFQEHELQALDKKSQMEGSYLLTTEKDWVRLPKSWQDRVAYLPVHLSLPPKDEATLLSLLNSKLADHVSL